MKFSLVSVEVAVGMWSRHSGTS